MTYQLRARDRVSGESHVIWITWRYTELYEGGMICGEARASGRWGWVIEFTCPICKRRQTDGDSNIELAPPMEQTKLMNEPTGIIKEIASAGDELGTWYSQNMEFEIELECGSPGWQCILW